MTALYRRLRSHGILSPLLTARHSMTNGCRHRLSGPYRAQLPPARVPQMPTSLSLVAADPTAFRSRTQGRTDPEWEFCTACAHGLAIPAIPQPAEMHRVPPKWRDRRAGEGPLVPQGGRGARAPKAPRPCQASQGCTSLGSCASVMRAEEGRQRRRERKGRGRCVGEGLFLVVKPEARVRREERGSGHEGVVSFRSRKPARRETHVSPTEIFFVRCQYGNMVRRSLPGIVSRSLHCFEAFGHGGPMRVQASVVGVCGEGFVLKALQSCVAGGQTPHHQGHRLEGPIGCSCVMSSGELKKNSLHFGD